MLRNLPSISSASQMAAVTDLRLSSDDMTSVQGLVARNSSIRLSWDLLLGESQSSMSQIFCCLATACVLTSRRRMLVREIPRSRGIWRNELRKRGKGEGFGST